MNLRSARPMLVRMAWQAMPTVIDSILPDALLMKWIPGDAADAVPAEPGSATAESMA